MRVKISIRKLSEMTGYSPATISNALNHKKGVNAETAQEIFRIAKETGYITEEAVHKIKLVIFKKNGLIIDDSPFFQHIINGFEQECRNHGYEMVICNLDQRDKDYAEQVRTLINAANTACVLLGTEMAKGDLEVFEHAKCTLILLDYFDDSMNFNSVGINNFDSAYMATQYLLDNGHSKIGYLRGSYRIKSFKERFQGYRAALKQSNAEYNEKYLFTLSTTLNGAYHDMLKYLEESRELPTAFFADNDMIALGAMKALQEKNIRIPDQVSVMGFDDLSYSEISSPRLTTIRVPSYDMGRLVVQRIADIMEKRQDCIVKLQVCTTFVERETVKKIMN